MDSNIYLLQSGRGDLYTRQNYVPMQELELKLQWGIFVGFYGIWGVHTTPIYMYY